MVIFNNCEPQESYIVFGKDEIPRLVSLVNDAATQMQFYIDKCNAERTIVERQFDAYQALPWYKRWLVTEPYYNWNGVVGDTPQQRERLVMLVVNRDIASAIYVTASDMELINIWAARWQLEIQA